MTFVQEQPSTRQEDKGDYYQFPSSLSSNQVSLEQEQQQQREEEIEIEEDILIEFDRDKFLWYALALSLPLHVLFLFVLIVLWIMQASNDGISYWYQDRYDMLLWVLLILWLLAFSMFFLTSYRGLMGQTCILQANTIEVDNSSWFWFQKRQIPYSHLRNVQLIGQKRLRKFCDVHVIAIDTIDYKKGTDLFLVGVKHAAQVQDAIVSRRLFTRTPDDDASSFSSCHPSNNIATMT
jgi:hypothetical protein